MPAIDLDAGGRPYIAYTQNTALFLTHLHSDANAWAELTFASYRDNNWEVYTSSADGFLQSRRSFSSAFDSTPKFNRGATRLVFVSDRDGNNEIYTMKADGTNLARLTRTSANEYWPTWSPDNTKIAFYSYRDGNAEIYVMNADGSGQTRLTNSSAWDGQPTWSHDGTQIAFASERSGLSELWLMSADGSNQHQLTTGSNAAYPTWSPNGTRIAFNDDLNNDSWLDVALINPDGTGLTHPMGATPGNYDYAAPVWFPDDHYLTFAKIQWTYYQGNYYWVDAYVHMTSVSGGSSFPLTSSGLDWWPYWGTTDVNPPSSRVLPLELLTNQSTFTVTWSGSDTGLANIKSYDIQYRDGANGAWTDWLSTNQTTGAFIGQDGHTYYFRSRARDYAGNLETYPGGNGDTDTTIDLTPPNSTASVPAIAVNPQFLVTLSGSDATSGVASYDVQYRDDALGQWIDWVSATAQTSRQFNGQLGHTYYFQSRARDKAGNLEDYPGDDGDTHTTTPLYALTGTVKGNRDQAIALASAHTTPAALNTPATDHRGNFALYYNISGTLSLTATRDIFGALPPMSNVIVSDVSSTPIVYLPPLDDQLTDGHFESGGLTTLESNRRTHRNDHLHRAHRRLRRPVGRHHPIGYSERRPVS